MDGTSTTSTYNSRTHLKITLIVLMVIANLLVGAVGGITGFVLLSNSTAPAIVTLRHRLGLDNANSKVTIPVTQNLHLEESSAIIDAAKKVSPAVVSITTNAQATDLFGQVSNQAVAGGTGFIITSDGLIMTNKHVVTAGTNYQVVLNDGRVFTAKEQAEDPLSDIAFLKIDAKDLPTVELGNSDSLQIGQYVIAVGNALGEYQNSVTLGVVSATHRQVSAQSDTGNSSENLSGLIQTDAAINPGNSGGPLVNLAGQVVGMNTVIATNGTGGSIGVGFAIPVNATKADINSVRLNGSISHPYLGVSYTTITTTVQQQQNLPYNYGALVVGGGATPAIIPGSPAEKAGLLVNDIILQVNGEQVNQNNTLSDLIQKYQVGDTVTLRVYDKGKEKDVKVTLAKYTGS
ncbi:trypsin-like peptidase domain-containing protein [Patescibacteria group bacterium]|nr:trypsin-like peptidase domain-containing protein [Patescibacteria group bacterium]